MCVLVVASPKPQTMRIRPAFLGLPFRDVLEIQEVPESSCFEGVVARMRWASWLLPKEKDYRVDSKQDSTYKGNRNWMSTCRI